MTVHEHRFTEPTPPFDLSGDDDRDWLELWDGYLGWLEDFEAHEFQTGDAR